LKNIVSLKVVLVLVQEVMTKKVIMIERNKTVFDACNMYKDYKVGCLIVIDNGKCSGIVTERDLIERTVCLCKDPEKTKVDGIMSKDIKTIHPLDTIDKALEIMIENNIKKLPVVLNEKIVGIITVTDISRARPDLSTRFIETWIKPRWID
jgi:CBS domain-containing protein